MPERDRARPSPPRCSACRTQSSCPASHSPPSPRFSPRGPSRPRKWPMLVAPPIATTQIPPGPSTVPRRRARTSSAALSLRPSTSTTFRERLTAARSTLTPATSTTSGPPISRRRPLHHRSLPGRAGTSRAIYWSRRVLGEVVQQGGYLRSDLVADGPDASEIQVGRVGQVPVDVALAWVDGAGVAATHGDDDVRGPDLLIGQPLGELARDVDADLRHGLDDGRVER